MVSFAEQQIATVDPGCFEYVEPKGGGGGSDTLSLCRQALREPVGSASIATLAREARHIAVVISDATRDEPRGEMLEAILEVVPRDRVTLLVASGTHPPSLEAVPEAFRDLPARAHDATDAEACEYLGRTVEGTDVRIAREAAHADLVVVTGRIRPHYFAGYSGGVKGLYPGLGHRDGVLHNHRLKSDPTSRLGRVDDNRCRLDLEAALAFVQGAVAVLDVLCDVEGQPVLAASGHPVEAHRFLANHARELFLVEAARAPIVVVADRPPVSRSLYQASKLLPPAGALLLPGGVAVVVAECDLGVEPLERVNEGIYRIGVSRQLPEPHTIALVSQLPPEVVQRTYATPRASLSEAIEHARRATGHRGAIPLIWRAGEAIAQASTSEARASR